MHGGEVFVPKIPSDAVIDLAEAMAPARGESSASGRARSCTRSCLTPDEARHAVRFESYYAVYPAFPFWRTTGFPTGEELPSGFGYSSDSNDDWLSAEQLREMAAGVEPV